MELTQEDVIRILKLIDESPMGRVSLHIGDLRLDVDKGTGAGTGAPLAVARAAPEPSAPVKAEEPAATQAPPAQDSAADADLLPIKAPLLGIFYRRSQPGAPPYVEEGSLVDEDTTVALIEVMKLFNPVRAGVKGRVVRVCAENNTLVEYEQVLFLVKPE